MIHISDKQLSIVLNKVPVTSEKRKNSHSKVSPPPDDRVLMKIPEIIDADISNTPVGEENVEKLDIAIGQNDLCENEISTCEKESILCINETILELRDPCESSKNENEHHEKIEGV